MKDLCFNPLTEAKEFASVILALENEGIAYSCQHRDGYGLIITIGGHRP